MLILFVAAAGLLIGRSMRTLRGALVAMAIGTTVSVAAQIAHVALSRTLEFVTLLPLVLGLVLVLCVFAGVVSRQARHRDARP
jgi:hypothetical protein